ncbi:MAG: UDP-N-acetylmuramoyl-L-alanyl-D-glutamate--2,6-diaminopimelate ligase [Oceanipulchritudo sp.]
MPGPEVPGVNLHTIIREVEPDRVSGFANAVVRSVACHPDQVSGPGFLFVCMDEYLEYNRWQTWRAHLEALPQLSLAAIVTPRRLEGLPLPQLITERPRLALARVARLLSGFPERGLDLFGVTGTNGKTTTTRLLAHLLNGLGTRCGSMGTLGVDLSGGFSTSGSYTTPLAPQIQESLARFRGEGAEAVAMEVSSHALALDRVEGLRYAGAILTNVERDHLDFHGTLEAYAEAKGRLFERVHRQGRCVLNGASPYCGTFAARASAPVLTFGMEGSGADVEARDLVLHPAGSRFTVFAPGERCEMVSRLAGSFQVENALAAIAVAQAQGHSLEAVAQALETFPPVCGRMEQIPMPNGCTAIVDYAHNPDGLKHLLEACRGFCPGRLHVVFGCGGDRDKGKRPLMGRIAAEFGDAVWVTSDNPRTEDPGRIMEDILAGMKGSGIPVEREMDRGRAIAAAFQATGPGDVLVVAGKGHEDYQLIGTFRHPFSDQAVLQELRTAGGS